MPSVARRRTEVPDTDKYVDDIEDDVEFEDDDLGDEEESEDVEESPARRTRTPGRTRPGGNRPGASRPGGRRTRSDEDGDRADRRRGTASTVAPVQRGWKPLEDAKSFSETLKFGDDEILLKILEEDPYASFQQHWFNNATGRKSFNCIGMGCPLCDVLGDDPRWIALFNVVDMSDVMKPAVKTWSMGKKLATKLSKLATKQRTKPLNREDLYFVVERTGSGLTTDYTVEAVVSEDLKQFYDTEPFGAEELAEFMEKVQGPESVKYDSLEFLEDLADTLA